MAATGAGTMRAMAASTGSSAGGGGSLSSSGRVGSSSKAVTSSDVWASESAEESAEAVGGGVGGVGSAWYGLNHRSSVARASVGAAGKDCSAPMAGGRGGGERRRKGRRATFGGRRTGTVDRV